jgi:hypothetical protein
LLGLTGHARCLPPCPEGGLRDCLSWVAA